MPAYQDYLYLASDAEDFAAWTPDPELAATCRRLAGSYCALARFHDQIFPLFGAVSNRPGSLASFNHVSATMKVMLVEDNGVVRATLADGQEEAGLHVSKYSHPRAALETLITSVSSVHKGNKRRNSTDKEAMEEAKKFEYKCKGTIDR
jgi:hypothetical protein